MDETDYKPCPECSKKVEYYELECNQPFTAPASLAHKALLVWGAYSTPKELIHQKGDFVHFQLGDTERLVRMYPFNQNEFDARVELGRKETQTCYHQDCIQDGDPCYTLFEPEKPMGFYCHEHKRENGICPGCSLFLSGFESFDFSESGYCDNCTSAMDWDDDRDDDWMDDDEYDYYHAEDYYGES